MANEKRLIDADDLQRKLLGLADLYNVDYLFFDVVNDEIDNAPTVDAVEVVHAYWTGSRFNPMTDEYEEYCSHCCAWSPEYGKPYCPNCGAKMDGGNEDG